MAQIIDTPRLCYCQCFKIGLPALFLFRHFRDTLEWCLRSLSFFCLSRPQYMHYKNTIFIAADLLYLRYLFAVSRSRWSCYSSCQFPPKPLFLPPPPPPLSTTGSAPTSVTTQYMCTLYWFVCLLVLHKYTTRTLLYQTQLTHNYVIKCSVNLAN